MADQAPPLRAEAVGRRYRRRGPWALRGVTLEFARGSITALVGPNGAGKSTLIRSWMGFEHPNEGRVLVEGIDPRRDRVGAVARIGYVPQAAALYRDLSVRDHLSLARVARPSFDTAYAEERLGSVGVRLDGPVGHLSGGEQAQVSLAIALGTRSPILLLDEPLASLDPLARREFLAVLVDDVRSTGATALLSSHIVTDVEQACDQLVVLTRGRLAYQAAVADARAGHRTLVVGADAQPPAGIVGFFINDDSQRVALVTSTDSTTSPATLEEIVLGYLAAGRDAARQSAAA
jgi:ABC-2 type transport system ATP-binding protein